MLLGGLLKSTSVRIGALLLFSLPAMAAIQNPARMKHGRIPLSFEPNVGQVRGAGSDRVKFVARRPGFQLFLSSDQITLRLENGKRRMEKGEEKLEIQNSKFGSSIANTQPRTPAVVRLRLLGANQSALMKGLHESETKSNYIKGNDPSKWRSNVPNYGRVRVANIYPGIDLIYYGHDGQLEYDFVIHPGADPHAIKLNLENGKWKIEKGKLRSENSANGDLLIPTAGGDLRLHTPVVYQRDSGSGERAFVKCRWKIAGDEIPFNSDSLSMSAGGFISSFRIHNSEFPIPESNTTKSKQFLTVELGPYDHTKDLIIDPVLSYSTYLGGTGYDAANAIAVDPFGNAYIAGQTDSLDFPNTKALQASLGGGTCGGSTDTSPCFDAFVTKLSPDGSSIVYSTFFGGSGDDRATGIAVDTLGEAFVTGITNSSDLPTFNAYQPKHSYGNCGSSTIPNPCFDAFVAKLGPAGGSIVYSTYLGGMGQDIAAGIALGPLGEATIVGSTSSLDFPVTPAAPQPAFGGGPLDAFVARLDPTGLKLIFSTYLGGNDDDRGFGVAVDAAGNTYVAGTTASVNFPAVNAMQNSNAGGHCGSSTSPTPCTDAFVAKLDPAGATLAYSTFLGGTGGDSANAIAVGADGSAYVAGSTTSTDFPVTPGSFQRSGAGTSTDAFVSKIASDGSALKYSTYLGGIGQEAAYGIAVDASGNAFVTGYANDAAFPVAFPVQKSPGGFNDAFLTKVSPDGSALLFSTWLGGTGDEAGQSVAVDSAGNAYVAGWTFSTDFPTASALEPAYAGGSYDAFVSKVSGLGPSGTSLWPTGLIFRDQGAFTASSTREVTLSNTGADTVAITTIAVKGDFVQTNNCGKSLAQNSQCAILVSFHPAAMGLRTGRLTVIFANGIGTLSASLAGTGITAFTLALEPQQATVVAGTDSATFTVAVGSSYSYSQGVALACDGNAAIQCAFNPPTVLPGGKSSLTVGQLARSASSIVTFDVMGTSEGQYASAPISVLISDFGLSSQAPVQTIHAGQQATFHVTLQTVNDFNQPISIECVGAPAVATCLATPATVAPGGESSVDVSVVVTTTAPALTIPSLPETPRFPWKLIVCLNCLLAGFIASHCAGKSTHSRGRAAWLAVPGLALALLAGCGGQTGTHSPFHRSGTPAGKYVLTVSGTSGQLVRTVPLTLQVD